MQTSFARSLYALIVATALAGCAPVPNPQDFSVPLGYLDGQFGQPCLVGIVSRTSPTTALVGCYPIYSGGCTQQLYYLDSTSISQALSQATKYSQLYSGCTTAVSRLSAKLNALQPAASLLPYDIGGADGPHVNGVTVVFRKVASCEGLGVDTSTLVSPQEGLALANTEGLLGTLDDTGSCRSNLGLDANTQELTRAVNAGEKLRYIRCYVGTAAAGVSQCSAAIRNDAQIQALLN